MPFTRLRQSLIQPNGSITGSLLGTASYAITSSYAMNGGSGGGSTPVVSVASLNNQTILYNFSSSQEATITGLTLTNNNWGINVVEEWNSIPGDLNISSCSLLMHFSGSNNSTTFIDSSRNNFVITASGNVKITSSISKFESGSGFFDGAGDNLLINYNTAFNLSSDFTIEVWFYPVSLNDSYILNFAGGLNIAWASYGLFVNANGVHFVGSSTNTGYDIGSEGSGAGTIGTLTLNTWSHIAVTRQGNVYRGFINGVQGYTQTLSLTPYNPNARGLAIGGNYANTWGGTPVSSINGYLDELRITKGVARYTGSFVTQSVQFPNSLPQYETKYIGLIGGLNDTGSDYGVQKLDDTSLKIRKMSVSGTPVSGSPILSASVDRVYVNVLNYSNISVGSTLLGQAFTAVGSTSSYALSRSVVNPYEIVVAVDGAVQSFNDAYSVTSSTINFTENIPSGSLVDIRYLTTPNVNSASYALTASYALNGGSGGGSVSTGSIVNQTILYNVTTSQDNTITGLNLTGNKWDISVIEEWNNVSIVGDEYYSSCSLLLHCDGTNGSTTFTDNSPTPKTVTATNGASISTAQSKFGGASGLFDGTDDYLQVPYSTINDLGTGGNWTVELWINMPSIPADAMDIIGASNGGGNVNKWMFNINMNTSFVYSANRIGFTTNIGGVDRWINVAYTWSTGIWYNIAVVYDSVNTTLYVNGLSVGSMAYNVASSTNGIRIGNDGEGYKYFNGYIDEVRITKGVARYTGNFTTSSVAFANNTGVTQLQTKYVGLVGGLNDSAVDYGIEKLSDSSLKIRKMTASGQPLSGSGTLSASVDRVYVNVLNYENAVITGSISNAVTASFAQTTPSGKSIALSFILG